MSDTVDWTAKSGKTYHYWFAGEMENPPMKKEPGNYMFVKQEGNGWVPIYIGETNNLDERLTNHPELPCVHRHGGTHLMAHTTSGERSTRTTEEADLIEHWKPPCNG